jgi:alkylated DNA repair dioxygenase AlkB
MSQMGLFGDELSGEDLSVSIVRQAISPADSDRLYAHLMEQIPWQQDYLTMFGKKAPLPRLTSWFGEGGTTYTYSGITMNPNPWTAELLEAKRIVEELSDAQFNALLLNLYRDGQDSVAWHADDEVELGPTPTIGSLSLGSPRTFQLRRKDDPSDRRQLELASGDLVIMSGYTQKYWLHRIPKTSKKVGPRINLTFRGIETF